MQDNPDLALDDQTLARLDISRLRGIKPSEVAKLRGAGINTVGEFWRRTALSAVPLEGFQEVEDETNIEGRRLAELLPEPLLSALAQEVLYRAERQGLVVRGEWDRPRKAETPISLRLIRSRRWVGRHLLDLLLVAGAALVLLLLLRASGALGGLPPPWGLSAPVVATLRGLKKDQTLRPDDLYLVRLPPSPDYFQDKDGLEGLILARDLPGQKPLRHEDLLRLQVVAARDVAPGDAVRAADFKLEWSPYKPTALLQVPADGKKARLAIRKGDIVVGEQVAQ